MNEPLTSSKSATGFRRIWRALFFSINGLRAAWTEEAAFRQELVAAVVLIPIALVLPATLTQKALLIACALLVLIVELVNSALEATVDRISLEPHQLAGRAKDIGSAAVLVALANLVVVWAMVLFEVFG
ncbi:MAG: diacylglycerol kinase (ATP) [Gammaproteobacteria bacterium]